MARLEDMRNPEERPPLGAMLIYLMLGPILWGLHLTLVYGAHTLICALSGSTEAATFTVIAATILTALPLGVALLNQRRVGRLFGIEDQRAEHRTYDAVARLAGVLSIAGILWAGTTIAIVSSCVLVR